MSELKAAHDDHGGGFATYMVVFAALSLFTAISFVVNRIYPPPHFQGAAIILGVAIVKAFLVALIFMHLKWDWSRLYFLIIPAFILGAVLIIVLMPDMVLSWEYNP
jgi:caa(3)-type oxidase subunit IV